MNLFFTRPDRYLHPGSFPLPGVQNVHIGGAPEFMKPLRALFLSDVHLRPGVKADRLDALIALIAAQRADIILMGGDYAESTADCLRFFEAFRSVRAPLGAYAVPGNNDADSQATLEDTMARAGVTLLRNRCVPVRLPDGTLEIAGCDDHKFGFPCTKGIFPPEENAYRILLSHYPVQPDCACELMLSGHTHGGQFNLLGLTPYSVGFEREFSLLGVKGLSSIGDMQLLVGSGIGTSRIPMRVGAAPQLYLLDFSK